MAASLLPGKGLLRQLCAVAPGEDERVLQVNFTLRHVSGAEVLGKAGCPTCYHTFYNRLLPSIRRIHGKTQHTGKVAQKANDGVKKERELQRLREQLEQCVAAQEYEKCAELRDKIQQLEQKGGETA